MSGPENRALSRSGLNPLRQSRNWYHCKKVTVCVLCFIPTLDGYFSEKLNILKVLFASIRRHTDVPYDLLVFDNGSCQEVVKYLQQLRSQGSIQFLILSRENLGTGGAFNFIFQAAPGEYLAYSDDDVIYFPGWLSKHLRVLEVYPTAAIVSGVPVWGQGGEHTESVFRYAHASQALIRPVDSFPWQWTEEWCTGTGRNTDIYLRNHADVVEYMLSRQGVGVYPGARSFQFVARKKLIRNILPLDLAGQTTTSADKLLHASLDAQGYLRLSTAERLSMHIGNTLTPYWQEMIHGFGLDLSLSPLPSPLKNPIRISAASFVKRLLQKVYKWSYHLSARIEAS